MLPVMIKKIMIIATLVLIVSVDTVQASHLVFGSNWSQGYSVDLSWKLIALAFGGGLLARQVPIWYQSWQTRDARKAQAARLEMLEALAADAQQHVEQITTFLEKRNKDLRATNVVLWNKVWSLHDQIEGLNKQLRLSDGPKTQSSTTAGTVQGQRSGQPQKNYRVRFALDAKS